MPQWIEWIGLSQGAATPPLGSAVPGWLAGSTYSLCLPAPSHRPLPVGPTG